MRRAYHQKHTKLRKWRDCLGRVHDLTNGGRVGLKEAADRLYISLTSVRRMIETGVLYPVDRRGSDVRVYEAALDDYVVRALTQAYRDPHLRG